MEKRISGRTNLLALFGTPVGHSGSPLMYNFNFEHHGLDYAYMAFDIGVDEMESALESVRLFKMRGCNLTMPCKNIATGLVDELSTEARIIGAVNTIVNDNGKLTGYCTDGIGFVNNLKEHNESVTDKKIVLFGMGGAATAIAVQCALEGAAEITIFNRKDEFFDRGKEIIEKLSKEAPDCKVTAYDLDDRAEKANKISVADLVINATKVGMKPLHEESLVEKELLRSDLVVADAVYNPEKTKMIIEAEEKGCKVIGGKGMLLHQGAVAYKLYTGIEMAITEYQEFLKNQ